MHEMITCINYRSVPIRILTYLSKSLKGVRVCMSLVHLQLSDIYRCCNAVTGRVESGVCDMLLVST